MRYLPIEGFEGYFAGDDGHIYSTRYGRNGHNNNREVNPRILKEGPTKTSPYMTVDLRKDGKTVTCRVHVLICEVFHGSRPDKSYDCSHINGNHMDNRPLNLMWETRSSNMQRKKEHGTWQEGLTHHASKFTEESLKEIKQRIANGESVIQLSKEIGIDRRTLFRIKAGERYA